MIALQNQTELTDLKGVNGATDQGSAVFAVPDPESSEYAAVKKIVVNPITYDEAVRRGQFTVAFKWVPRELSTFSVACPTPGALCVDGCVARDLCLCVNGRCQ